MIARNHTCAEINKFLVEQEKNLLGGPLYRLVWSNEQTEFRKGVFNEFSESGLFLRTVEDTREMPKYPYIESRFVFEKWGPPEIAGNAEIPKTLSDGDYIPVYVFEDSKGNYLPPTMKVIEFLLGTQRGLVRQDDIPSREYVEAKQKSRIIEELDDHPAGFSTHGEIRNAVGYTGAKCQLPQ